MRRTGNDGRIALVCALGLLAIMAAAVAVTSVAEAGNAPRRQTRSTQVGVAPSDLVTLRGIDITSNPKFVRVGTDGSIGSTEFFAPTGRVLVATDVLLSGTYRNVGVPATLRVFLENRTTASTRTIVHAANFDAATNSSERPGGVQTLSAVGFVMDADARLTFDVRGTSAAANASVVSLSNSNVVILIRGYLANAE